LKTNPDRKSLKVEETKKVKKPKKLEKPEILPLLGRAPISRQEIKYILNPISFYIL